MQQIIIEKLLKMTKQAVNKEEVPVASLIVYKNKIIAKSYNKRIKTNDPTAHAEINCIRKASRKLKTTYLTECVLYTTLTPCEMCKSVIKESRIKKVYYILENDKKINKNTELIKIETKQKDEFKKILSNFFKDKR